MRIDLFLKASGILKSRSMAAGACAAGAVTVNGKTAKSSSGVVPGSIVTVLRPRGGSITFRVDSIPGSGNVPRADRASLFTVLEEDRNAD